MIGAHLRTGMRVVVAMAPTSSAFRGDPPVCTTATVLEPTDGGGHWWVNLDLPTGGTLRQMYRPEEIAGLWLGP